MQIKAIMRHYFSPIRILTTTIIDNNNCWWGCGEIHFWWEHRWWAPDLWLGAAQAQATVGQRGEFLKRLNTGLPYDPAIPLLGMYPRELKTYMHTKTRMNVHRSIIHNNPKVETTQCPSTNEWINKMWHIHTMDFTMEYYSAIKRNEVLIDATRWMNLENIMLREGSQTQNGTYCMIPFIWNVQNKQIYRDRK